ncbi:MAG: metallophosphoesterase family protein, partial [Pseudomonadaceae bacterium]
MRIGLIADTHGLLRPEALAALRGCTQIIHAGDVGKPAVLDGLRAIAPLAAIRGNVDHGDWALALPERLDLRIAGLTLHVLHDLKQLDRDPVAAGI